MFKRGLKYTRFALAAFVFLTQCTGSGTPDEHIVARVGDNVLLKSELAEIITSGMNPADSALLADDYIKKWVKQELVIQKANENLSSAQKDVSKELKEYRNSLIIYKYKNELMRQRMDTLVTREQIERYYTQNPDNFNLDKNIVKAIYAKIPNEVANPALLKSMMEDNSDRGLEELRDYCLQYAKAFNIFIDNWIDFEVLNKNLPNEIRDAERFLKTANQIEVRDSAYYYLVSIQDYKLKNEAAPLDYVEFNIKNLILNQRKIGFLKQVEENIYKEGIRKNKFEITNNER